MSGEHFRCMDGLSKSTVWRSLVETWCTSITESDFVDFSSLTVYMYFSIHFRRPFVKRAVLCYRTVVCLSVCLSVLLCVL